MLPAEILNAPLKELATFTSESPDRKEAEDSQVNGLEKLHKPELRDSIVLLEASLNTVRTFAEVIVKAVPAEPPCRNLHVMSCTVRSVVAESKGCLAASRAARAVVDV